MSSRARAAALLPVWVLVAIAGLLSTIASTAVAGSRVGCVENGLADLVAVGAMAAVGFALAALLLVAAVPAYRAVTPAIAASAALALSASAAVTFLSQDGMVCGL